MIQFPPQTPPTSFITLHPTSPPSTTSTIAHISPIPTPTTSTSSRLSTPPPKRPRDPSPPPSPRKRHRQAPYNPPGPGPGPLICLTKNQPAQISFTHTTRPPPAAELPDEVLVSIFRFVDDASRLARLRTVCQQWCRVIDDSPAVWRAVSFKNARFVAQVICKGPHLTLGNRPGRTAVSLAACSGNEWARFLKRVLFERLPLCAVTMPQPIASRLVAGRVALYERPFAPWNIHMPGERNPDGVWVAVHAARRGVDAAEEDATPEMAAAMLQNVHLDDMVRCEALPTGAMVGMVHVREAFQGANGTPWIWRIDRAVSLRRPVRCAGFVGLWSVSGFLTDLLVNAMHSQ